MPNFSLVASAPFQNRSFDDMLKPLTMYTEEYNALENNLNELDTKASVWENMANQETDPIAYAQYMNYARSLRDSANHLANKGLDAMTRKDVLDLKRRYAAEVAPIEEAYNARKAQVKEQRDALLKDPTLLFSRRADTTSLDSYLLNPTLGYENYSGALLEKQVGDAASILAKELRAYGRSKSLSEDTMTWFKDHGFTKGQVEFAIEHPEDPRSSKVLRGIVEKAIENSGIAEWADQSTLDRAYGYANEGLWKAVGQTDISTFQDPAASYRMRLAAAANAAQQAKIKGLAINPLNLYSRKEGVTADGKYDATKATEFDFSLHDSQQSHVKGIIQTASRGVPLQEVEWDGEKGEFVPTGETMDFKTLDDNNCLVLATRFSPFGSVAMIKDKNGEVRRYKMPEGINPTAEHNRDINLRAAAAYQNIIASREIPTYRDANGVEHSLMYDIHGKVPQVPEGIQVVMKPIDDAYIAKLQQQYEAAVTNAYLYHSQLGLSNKTESQNFNPLSDVTYGFQQ